MTLIEAIKSGRRFRRSEWDGDMWVFVEPTSDLLLFHNGDKFLSDTQDLCAEDYVVEGDAIRLTQETLLQAFAYAWTEERPSEAMATDVAATLARRLGLGDPKP